MNAVFCGRRRNRIAVQTDYGYIVAEAIDDCELQLGEAVSGVNRDHGTQYWSGLYGDGCEVYVEAFDASREWASNWLQAG